MRNANVLSIKERASDVPNGVSACGFDLKNITSYTCLRWHLANKLMGAADMRPTLAA